MLHMKNGNRKTRKEKIWIKNKKKDTYKKYCKGKKTNSKDLKIGKKWGNGGKEREELCEKGLKKEE